MSEQTQPQPNPPPKPPAVAGAGKKPPRKPDRAQGPATPPQQPPPSPPKKTTPVSDEELKSMEKNIPFDDRTIFSGFDEQASSVPGVIGGFIGLQDKGMYSIFQRSIVDPDELAVCHNMKRIAEHGIGVGSLDRPMLRVGVQLVDYLTLKVSIKDDKTGQGQSRKEAVDALTSWTKTLEQREAQVRQQAKGAAS